MASLEEELALLQGVSFGETTDNVASVQAQPVQPQTVQSRPQPVQSQPVQAQASAYNAQPTYTPQNYVVQQATQASSNVNNAPVYNAPVTTNDTVNTMNTAGVVNESEEEENLDFDIDFGQVVSTLPIEKIKGRNGDKLRLAFFYETKNGQPRIPIMQMKVHWSDAVGSYFKCFDGECCMDDLKPAVNKYWMPVIEYPTIPTEPDQLIPNRPAKLKLLVLNQQKYQLIVDIIKSKGDLNKFDLIASCMEEQYQNFAFLATENSYRSQVPNFNALVQKWASVKPLSYKTVARVISRDNYLKLTGKYNGGFNGADVGTDAPSFNEIIQ